MFEFACPSCGAPFIETTVVCTQCGTENDMGAMDCATCGKTLFSRGHTKEKLHADDIFGHGQMDSLAQTVADRFSLSFEKRLKEEHHKNLHGAYIDRFFKSDFRPIADARIHQLAEGIQPFSGDKKEVEKQRDAMLNPAFEELLDYFIIRYCADLNEAKLPEAILRYHGQKLEKLDFGKMINEYLEFAAEDEPVYFDFVTMPPKKLKNAAESFLHPKKGETIHFICDLSMLGSCKEGFAMTDQCIYWKMPMESKQRVYYSKLKKVQREEDWMTINGIFFNASKTLNIKLLRLLKRLMLG